MTKLLAALVLAVGCGGQMVDPPATCTQVGYTVVWGGPDYFRYECDSDPAEGCVLNAKGEYECREALKFAKVVCQ